jgi:hypothetical protein
LVVIFSAKFLALKPRGVAPGANTASATARMRALFKSTPASLGSPAAGGPSSPDKSKIGGDSAPRVVLESRPAARVIKLKPTHFLNLSRIVCVTDGEA